MPPGLGSCREGRQPYAEPGLAGRERKAARGVRALLSVYDKTGLGAFAKGLAELGFELVTSGGTATFLEEQGLAVTRVESVTEFPELLGGRVKTLHPRIHAGILARRGLEDDLAELEGQGIETFDLVCINLYPFEQVAASRRPEQEIVEMIDVGGPAMLRAAAKNHSWVTPVCRPEDYDDVLRELRSRGGETSLDTRRRLATAAFARTAAYDAAIAAWFAEDERFPETYVPVFDKVSELAYGENPHQGAAYYAQRGARTHLLARVEQVHGRELSFNNLNDLNGARLCLREFTVPACVIVKHANPCGVALGETIEEAYERALAADPDQRLRRRRRAQPAGERGARGAPGRAVRRGSLRARLRRGGRGGPGPQAEHADPERHGAPRRLARPSTTSSASSAGSSSRIAIARWPTARA